MAEKPGLDPAVASSLERKIVLPVLGMHCAACVAKIERALRRIRGVRAVGVDLSSRTVEISFVESPAANPQIFRRAIEAAGYDVVGESESRSAAEGLSLAAQQTEQNELWRRLEVSVVLSFFLLSAHWLNLSSYTALLLALPLQLYGGWHFHKGLYRSLIRGSTDMNTLVSISTWAAFLYSAYVVVFPETLPVAARQTQWDAVAGLITMITFGRWLEAKTRARTNETLFKLMRIAPKTVRVLREGREKTVALSEVKAGEVIRVHPGEQVGLDGVVVSGASTVDESLLTGESLPVEKSSGSHVWGGTINKTGAFEVRVSRPGEESALARIVSAVRGAQATKPRIQKLVDRIAAFFVPFVVISGAASAVIWASYGPEPKILLALTSLISVFAVACPCALGLATPLAVIAGMGRAAELGIFIRDADMLEQIGRLDVIMFDKTGTLTHGKPQVVEMLLGNGSREDLLRYALAAEERSEHPYAAAITVYAKAAGAAPMAVDSFESLPGRGVLIRSGQKTVRAGSLSWLKEEGCVIPKKTPPAASHGGGSVLGVALNREFLGAFILADTLRPSARQAVRRLAAMGLETVLVSGDRTEAVLPIAEQAGIGSVFCEVRPEAKALLVAKYQAQGKKVAMVGEGFNDAPALSRANVGIALASGTDIAIEAADMTVMNSDLTTLAAAIILSRKISRVIRQNLFWAFAYNVALIPVAAGALYPLFGLLLRPQYAGGAMALSSISVALNSLRLRRSHEEKK